MLLEPWPSSRDDGHAGTNTVLINLNGVQCIMDIFEGCCDTKKRLKSISEILQWNSKNCKHLTSKSEWYEAYKISMRVTDREKLMKSESWPQRIFVRKYFKARTGRNSSEQQS